MNLVLLLALLVKVFAGVWTAIFYRWGSSWYATSAPSLYSFGSFPLRTSVIPLATPTSGNVG
jgi:nitrate reductase gamma subunit